MGLSPHGRGNRESQYRARPRVGSIPARAGEPTLGRGTGGVTLVYPRTGGGTTVAGGCTPPSWGLSPHGRGNL